MVVKDKKPTVVVGGILIGKLTQTPIEPVMFDGNTTLLNSSNLDLYHHVNGSKEQIRKRTLPLDVVKSVLKITHADLSITDKDRLSATVDHFVEKLETEGIDLSDRDIAEAIKEKSQKIGKLDFMRGMQAFRDAEYEQHQGIYEHTIIIPATRLASWLILREAEIEHV